MRDLLVEESCHGGRTQGPLQFLPAGEDCPRHRRPHGIDNHNHPYPAARPDNLLANYE